MLKYSTFFFSMHTKNAFVLNTKVLLPRYLPRSAIYWRPASFTFTHVQYLARRESYAGLGERVQPWKADQAAGP